MNLELFYKKFQSIILQLIHNNLLHLPVALNILLYSTLLSRATRWNYKTTEYLRMKGVLDSIELQLLRRVDSLRAQNPPNINTDGVT